MKADLIGQRLGDFEIIRELGRGGMGVVYEARQVSLNRRVALKVLGPGLGLTAKAVERFHREAEAAAKLHHTNIVPVYATGEQDGIHFYAMELIDGPSLDAVIRDLRDGQLTDTQPALPPNLVATGAYVPAASTPTPTGSGSGTSADRFDRAATMIADVADALHHAHLNGVTHRDIKPSNLLLSADGRLSVTDFGLARMLEQPGMTVTGEFVGTPAYMSPEQITAGRIPVDHRTDIYSLGATLYELLTLRPPFVADGRDMLLALVIQKEPPSPRRVNPKVPRDLETICLKCLEKDPDRRYATAKELADDLRRYVNRFAILAKRAGPLARMVKWTRRNPAVAGLVVVVLLASGTVSVFSYKQHKQAEQQRADELRHTEEVRGERLRSAMDRAMLEGMGGRYDQAEGALADAEQLGASAGEVRFLRGMIALYRDDAASGVKELKQAVVLMPDSVAAQAYLAYALNMAGDLQGAERCLKDCLVRGAITADDFLFRGAARMFSQPEAGLADIKEAIRLRPSTLALVLRADAEAMAAEQTGNLETARDAIRTASLLRELLPDPRHVASSAVARSICYQLCRKAGLEQEAKAILRDLESDIRILKTVASPSALWARGLFHHIQQDWPGLVSLSDEIERIGHEKVDSWIAEPYAVGRLRQGRAADALAFLDRLPDRDRSSIYAHRVLLMLEADGRGERALAEYRRVSDLPRTSPVSVWELGVWCHCGQLEEATRRARAMREAGWKSPPDSRPEWHLAALDYYCGDATEERLLKLASGSRDHTAWTHWTLGNVKLARKEYAAAATHFREYERIGVVMLAGIHWPPLWVERLEKDPNWPPWIKNPKK